MRRKKTTDEYLSEMGYSLFDEYAGAVEFAAITEGARVFDAATGSGRMTSVLSQKGYPIISGDIDWHKLDALVDSPILAGDHEIECIQLDLQRLCFRDSLLDNIVCANLFHEVKHPERVLSELLRIFSGSGKMVLLDFTERGFSVMDEISRMRYRRAHTVKGTISCKAIRSLLKESKLDVRERNFPLNWVYVVTGKG
jgi:ubiquinone/menaquinone biosynthesis C-methylase UbiE